jgi:glutamate N-acetyltransferase/amino-acid N-acetyltransferase
VSPALAIPAGFLFASANAGIKPSGRADLAAILVPQGAAAAALFTRNRVVAAPLTVGRQRLPGGMGRLRAVLVNSGNANCATGAEGLRACRDACRALAAAAGVGAREVFPSSTGIIGVPFPLRKVTAALSPLLQSAAATRSAVDGFSRAILTTDSRPKLSSTRFRFQGRDASLLGIAKGAGMIHPDMATMLVYLCTDAALSPAQCRRHLRAAAEHSFQCISIDGDTSTNDTVLLLSSGGRPPRPPSSRDHASFARALAQVTLDLAHQIVADGEGVKHLVRLTIEQARSAREARQVASTIATSMLVKTAWAGADPNWGRILAAAGRSGVPVVPARMEIWIGPYCVFRQGVPARFDAARVHACMSRPRSEIRVRLGRGRATATCLTSDLTAEYVRINADYST